MKKCERSIDRETYLEHTLENAALWVRVVGTPSHPLATARFVYGSGAELTPSVMRHDSEATAHALASWHLVGAAVISAVLCT